MEANRRNSTHAAEVVAINSDSRGVSPTVALRKLYELLEAYSPMWYTEEAHDLARAALREQGLR